MTTDKTPDSLDAIVDQLYTKLEEKKKSLQRLDHPSFTTPIGSFAWQEGSQEYNLNTFKVDSLIKVKAHIMACEHWYMKACDGVEGKIPEFKHQGFTLKEWIEDIDTLINRMNITQLKSDISKLELRLSKLVSPEMQRQRELAKLAKDIDNF